MKRDVCYVDYDPQKTVLNEPFLNAVQGKIYQHRPGLLVLEDARGPGIVQRVEKLAVRHEQTGLKITLDRSN